MLSGAAAKPLCSETLRGAQGDNAGVLKRLLASR